MKRLCERLGLQPFDFDVIELNEAFASQAPACLRGLGLPEDAGHVNPNGGAIALGHPLGMSGVRIAGAAALELKRRGGRYALAAMCVGVGQSAAIAMQKGLTLSALALSLRRYDIETGGVNGLAQRAG